MDSESRVFARLMRSLNDHLPAQRKALGELLGEEKPRIACRDGSSHRIKKEELRRIEDIVRLRWGEKAEGLKLPLLIEMAPDYGRSTARIRGRIYCDLVQTILQRDRMMVDEMVLYRPDIRKLRRELPSTTQYAFLISTS